MHTSTLARIRPAPIPDSPDVLSSQAAAGPSAETADEPAPHENPAAGAAAVSAVERAWQLVDPQRTEQSTPRPLSYEAPQEAGRHRGQHRDPIGAALGAVWVLGNIVTLLLLGWIANGQLTEQAAGKATGSYAGSPDTPLP